jgi:hypothetical protein
MVDYLPTDVESLINFKSDELELALQGNKSAFSLKLDDLLIATCICHKANRVSINGAQPIFKSMYPEDEA